ncbi:MAG: hypothetical protein ACM3OO_06110 [Planctomycetaceae bacterium]
MSTRAAKTGDRSKVARKRLLVGLVAVLVVVGGVGFLLTRGSSGGGILGIGKSAAPAVPVHFKATKVEAERGAQGVDQKAMKASLAKASDGVTKTLDSLFTTGYSDPGNWGDPGNIQDLFVSDAAQNVQNDVNTLTIGENAGDYESLQPVTSTVLVRPLIDQRGAAVRAYADATFVGLAKHTDGTYTKITVQGSFFLIPGGDGWKIEAYRATRSEKPAKAPASPTASASTGASS